MELDDEKFVVAMDVFKKAKNILFVAHYKPDGDALSSMCAMIELALKMKKDFTAFVKDPPPEQFSFLPNIELIKSEKNWKDFKEFDLIVVLDCGQLERTALVDEINNRIKSQTVMEFDHHPKMYGYADLELRYTTSSSTAEIVYNFFYANNIKINKRIADCILTGIITDTNNLLNDATTDAAIKIVSKMMLYGSKYSAIIEDTLRNKSLEGMKSWGKVMSSLEINKKYNLAVSVVTEEDLLDSNVSNEELEGVANFLSSIEGVKGVLFLREEKNNKIKGSLRTIVPGVDISVLAKKLGGGGHPKASGFLIEGRIEKLKKGWRIVD